MAFKSIGTLAGDVLLKAKAARANQVALKFGAPHLTRREAEGGEALAQSALEPDAQLLNGEGATVSNGGLVTRASGDQHASGSPRVVRQTEGRNRSARPASTIADRSIVTVTAPKRRVPLPLSAVIIDLAVVRLARHAARA